MISTVSIINSLNM